MTAILLYQAELVSNFSPGPDSVLLCDAGRWVQESESGDCVGMGAERGRRGAAFTSLWPRLTLSGRGDVPTER